MLLYCMMQLGGRGNRPPLDFSRPGPCHALESESVPDLTREMEAELATRLLAGDPEAFDRFVEHFRTKIFHYSWLLCGQREDAEEVVQEALMRVFENLGDLREPARVRPWVFQIAKNACLMKRRKSVFAPAYELSLDESLAEAGLQVADLGDLPDARVIQLQTRAVLDQAIAALPENYRCVILLRDVEDLSTLETAQILDLSEDVVKMRLHRARVAVRKTLEGTGVEAARS